MSDDGTIFLIGGLNDPWRVTGGWDRGLAAAGLPHRREVVHWQGGGWSYVTLSDLWDADRHRTAADELRAKIRTAAGPVHLIAHSSGTAVAALAVAGLADGESVASVVFVGSALSAEYDLTTVLARCEYGLLSVESHLDFLHLGVGTWLVGTTDRKHGAAAGMVGFRPPAAGYPKLQVIRWKPEYAKLGWIGEHLTQGADGFAQEVLAGWVRQAEGGAGSGLRANIQSSTG